MTSSQLRSAEVEPKTSIAEAADVREEVLVDDVIPVVVFFLCS